MKNLRRSVIILFLFAVLISCKESAKVNEKCSDCSALYLHQNNNYYRDELDPIIALKTDSNQLRMSVLEITSLLDSVSMAMIDITGGVTANGIDRKKVCIAYPCNTGGIAVEMFKKTDLVNRIRVKVDQMKLLKPENKGDEELVRGISRMCEYYLLSDSAYINTVSLKNKEYALTILDINILENTLYSYLIMDLAINLQPVRSQVDTIEASKP